MNSQIAVDQINEQGHLTIGGVEIGRASCRERV